MNQVENSNWKAVARQEKTTWEGSSEEDSPYKGIRPGDVAECVALLMLLRFGLGRLPYKSRIVPTPSAR